MNCGVANGKFRQVECNTAELSKCGLAWKKAILKFWLGIWLVCCGEVLLLLGVAWTPCPFRPATAEAANAFVVAEVAEPPPFDDDM